MAEPDTGGDTISRNAILALGAQMTTAAFTAGITIFLTRELGPAGFGLFSLALSATAVILRPAGAGTSQAVGRFIAERHGDHRAIRPIIRMASRIRVLSACAFGVVLFALADPIASLYGEPDLTGPLQGMAVAFVGQNLFDFFRTIFVSLRLTSKAFASVTAEASVEAAATVALVLGGAGVTGAAFGRAAGYAFGVVFAVALLGRVLGRSPLLGADRSPVPRSEFFGYAGALFVVATANSVFQRLGVLLLGAFLPPSAVGLYSAPLRLISLIAYPALAVAQGVGPRQARHATQPARIAALGRGVRYAVILHAGVIAFLLVWAPPIVELVLGPEFSGSAGVLRALTPFILLNGMGVILFSSLGYAGEGRRRIPVAMATVVVAAVLYIALIPPLGTVGAAIATDIGYLVNVGGHLWLAHRFLGLPVGPIFGTFARSGLAAGATVVVLVLATGGGLSVAEWVLGSLLGSATFVTVLVLTGALTRREIRRFARRPVRSRRPPDR
ncbi:MAG: oligosaccharide flippase family protein [Solirubrobacterales bacterium]|nr:oligosaccharide flippase family protein [Solirubrobacterales bacterium]